MLSRPYLETVLWFLVLLLMLLALFWVIDPWHLRHKNIIENTNHAQHESPHKHDSHNHHWDKSEALISLEGLISWRVTSSLKSFRLSSVTTKGNIIIFDSNSLELIHEEWVELTLPESSNTYLVEAQWSEVKPNSALEISFSLGQREKKSWFFWGDKTENIKQVLEY